MVNKGSNKRKTVALIIDTLSGMGSYQEDIWHGVVKAVKATGNNLLIFPGGSIDTRPENKYECNRNIIYEIIQNDNIDGIILSGGTIGNFVSHERFEKYIQRFNPIPMVSISASLKGIPNIMIDNETGFEKMINHLIMDHKYREIAYISGPEGSEDALKRMRVFKRVLAKNNIPFNDNLFFWGEFNEPSGHEAIRVWLDQKKLQFRAVVAANDNMAIGALKELLLRGIKVPSQVAVAGFDDIVEAGVINPGLTTIRQSVQLQVEKAVEILTQMLEGKYLEQGVIKIDTEMVIRKSCGCTGGEQGSSETIVINENASNQELLETFVKNVTQYRMDENEINIIKKLFVGFMDELQEKQKNIFLLEWEEFVNNHLNENKDILIINKCIAAFHEAAKHLEKSKEVIAENIIYKAQNRLMEIVSRIEAKKRTQVESLSHQISVISTMLAGSFDIGELTDIIAQVMPTLNIKNFIFSLYKDHQKPLEAVSIICQYRNGERVELPKEGVTLPAQQIVDMEFLSDQNQINYAVYPLYFKDEQLGLFLIELAPDYGFVYETIYYQLSTSIEGAFLVDRNNQVLKVIEKHSRDIENLTLPMMESIKDISEIATNKMKIVNELADQTQESWDKISETSRNIEKIASHINKLLNIIKIIEDIVDKVNLLALNTSIEAAHVGQYGVGFSVIAKEIKKLSETTRIHSNEIAQTLKDIVKYAQDTSRYGQESMVTFQSQKQGVKDILSSFETISQKMQELGNSSTTILNMIKKK